MRQPVLSRQQATMLRMLVRLRERAHVNQTRLAQRLGITQSEVSKYERGERTLDVLRLRVWLRALDVELSAFADALDHELDEQLGTRRSPAARPPRMNAVSTAASDTSRRRALRA
jgi:transcriptional regulator with XRE-family HTH domain